MAALRSLKHWQQLKYSAPNRTSQLRPPKMRRCCLRALVCWALLVSASATPLKYLSYYTFDFFKHGANITALGSANIAPPLNDDPVAAAIFRDLHGLPSMITPGKAPRGRASAVAAPEIDFSCRRAVAPRPQAAFQGQLVSLRLRHKLKSPAGARQHR